jgi:hypothetical protein
MSNVNHQTDHRELSEEEIKARLLKTLEGDEVLFNDRVQPLTVTKCPRKEWEVHFRAKEGYEVIKTVSARNKDERLFEVGESVHYQLGKRAPSYEVTRIDECECENLDIHSIKLEGPRGGEYSIRDSRNGVRIHNDSANKPPYGGSKVYWFENRSR